MATGALLDASLRCAEPFLNTVATITPVRWVDIAAQLGGGNGGELKPTGKHRPKFSSAFSSSALAVNSFGPFDSTRVLSLPQLGEFPGGVVFEAQRSAGVRGYKPNLDFVAEPASGDWLFGESKCLEFLRPHRTAFSDAFVARASEVLSSETAAVYADFGKQHAAGGHGYQLVDAAQLLKHFLAAKLASASGHKVALAYLFWEPLDAIDHSVFAVHREEAAKLAGELADDDVQLVPLSYPAVWAHWEELDDAELTAHVDKVRARYEVTLGPIA